MTRRLALELLIMAIGARNGEGNEESICCQNNHGGDVITVGLLQAVTIEKSC